MTPSPLPFLSISMFRVTLWCWLAFGSHAAMTARASAFQPDPNRCNDVDISRVGDAWDIKTTGRDPFLIGDLSGIGPNDVMLELEYFATEGVKGVAAFIGASFSQQTLFELPSIPASETWTKYQAKVPESLIRQLPKRNVRLRLDLGRHPGVRLQIRSVRFLPMTATFRRSIIEGRQIQRDRERRADQITAYLQQEPPTRIESVVVSKDRITLTGKLLSSTGNTASTSAMQIIECPPHVDITYASPGIAVNVPIQTKGDWWRAVVPRRDGQRDRLHSSWRIAFGDDIVSGRRFATEIQTIGNNHPKTRVIPTSQKGLGGVDATGPIDELTELGISAITVNIILGSMLSDKPGPGRELIPIDSNDPERPPIYFNSVALRRIDKTLSFASRHNMVVSGILLISSKTRRCTGSPLIHPDNDGGTYSMPNLTDPYATEIYAYLLDQLGRRYSNPTSKQGGISNWVVHNEVDAHQAWTNMGKQPRPIVTETYYRSMRMVHNAVRQYNPHARVFASLTHQWSVKDDGNGTKLAPQEVVTALQRYSLLEGDFAWGLAYHPYPQSLFAPTAWNDTKITDQFDTPLITIQNIDVLQRFMAQRLMLDSNRQPRPILLSEQGFHTESYDEDDQANQAASLAYAMKQIAKIPSIESFHYHRWIDNPNEGGLKLGLRTLPSPGKPHGEKKQSWFVYQAIGTPSEPERTRHLPQPDR
ncbi:hypothetical protein LF1_24480 [Rubripirellula obstinata]|uniref:DUF5722 domain-containing protein n=1 Tax=Rubripirellula obstinata TaxID=406547 RepID=A0A5B1CI51_9BACT|nr:DUF5722 domain-containing protein [Rubripirellula obstinata]KAA1259911.1 hypothetical protein LF1_24480 [Rubripirellula obstinata]